MITNYDYTIACPHCPERFRCKDTDKKRVQREAAQMFADHMQTKHPEKLDTRMERIIMSKQYIKTFLAALADLANRWNEPPDEEQGWGNDPVVLIVYDDGSGFIGDGQGVHKLKGINIAEMEHVTIQGEFSDLDQAFEYLDEWLPNEADVETFQ